MSEIAELERRITAALERIGTGLERLSPGDAGEPDLNDSDEMLALRAALDEEKTANAQLAERLRAVKDRDAQSVQQMQERIEAMTRQLDVQGLEMQRMRKTTIQLRENLRALREAQAQKLADPHMVNKAMLAELEALRATRATETAELDELLAELTPLVRPEGGEVREDA
ncbi:MAG TPA: hypothetical protein VGA75_07550 [Paracoccaceae bacterium]